MKLLYILVKAAKQWEQAGASFRNAARLLSSDGLNLRHDAAQALVDAGMSFRKSNTDAALDAYKEAVDILVDMGRFSMAAKHLAACGDILAEVREFNRWASIDFLDQVLVNFEHFVVNFVF